MALSLPFESRNSNLKCQFCGKEESLPFACNYCGGTFCSEHRLPEAHQCTGDLSRKPVIVTQAPSTFSWQGTSGTYTSKARRAPIFSRIEVRDIVIAWAALGLAFYFAYFRGGQFSGVGFLVGLAISLATVGSGIVLHELSHKFVAERYGYWAEFRVWPMGILALATSLIGFIFAAPGATYISGSSVSESANGKISLAGPLTNVAVALVILPFASFSVGSLGLLGFIAFSINMFLATFNMLPIMSLDGAKVLAWNKVYWAAVFLPLALLNAPLIFAPIVSFFLGFYRFGLIVSSFAGFYVLFCNSANLSPLSRK